MKRSILRPVWLPLLEHPLAHDVRARSLECLVDDAIVIAGLTATPEPEAPPETLLKKHPFVDPGPAVTKRVLRSPIRPGDEPVERHPYIDEYVAHLVLPCQGDVP